MVRTKSLSFCIYIFTVARKDSMYIERHYVHTFSPVTYVYSDSMYIKRLCVQNVSLVIYTYLQWRRKTLYE